MTLGEALAHGRLHHRQLEAAKARLRAARLEARVPDALWLPSVGAFAEILGATTNNSTATLLNQPTVDIPRIGATRIGEPYGLRPYPSTAVAIGVRQELYDFGRIAAERAAVELLSEIERLAVEDVGLELGFGIAQAYYAVLAAVAIVGASESALERASTHREVARAGVESGMRPPIELTRAEADVAKYQAGMERARGNLHAARSVFAAAVAVDDIELDASSGAPTPATPLPLLNDALALASANPNVLLDRARVRAQQAETDRLEAQARPNLFATAGINGRAGGAPPSVGSPAPGGGWAPLVPNYHIGVVLSWPLLEPIWARRADASRERETALASGAADTVRRLRAAIAVAWHEAEVTTSTLAALQRGVEATRANYDQANNRFHVGLGTSTELADAQAVRTEAEIQLAIGRFQMARARAALDRAIAASR
jgi:outer membrane protein TolC